MQTYPLLKGVIKKLVGSYLFRIDVPAIRRHKVLRSVPITLVLDVGASEGQFGSEIRLFGYKGRIISFEPLASAFSVLAKRVSRDPRWEARNIALCDKSGSKTIHVAANSQSSSLLEMQPEHLRAAPYSKYVSDEMVSTSTLDDIWTSLCAPPQQTLLKMDVQGSEKAILAGAKTSLTHIAGLFVELSFVELYEGSGTFFEMCSLIDALGFQLMSLEPGFTDPQTGRLLQTDVLFVRKELLNENRTV